MEKTFESVQTVGQTHPESPVESRFLNYVSENGIKWLARSGWLIDGFSSIRLDEIEGLKVVSGIDFPAYRSVFGMVEGLPVVVVVEISSLRVLVGCKKDKGEAKSIIEMLRKVIPEARPETEVNVPVNFWVDSPKGPLNYERNLDVVEFEKIRENYPADGRGVLDTLMAFKPMKSGQLFLFSGPPGTGKTYAIRSLFWAWRRWADFHVIVDVNNFFGGDANYLMNVLLHRGDGSKPPVSDFTNDDTAKEAMEDLKKGKWKVIVLEDSGSLVSVDAKEQSGGQALSQLLNTADGLLGQGMRVLFIITTNEEIEKLHPAVSRPGRCAVRHNFRNMKSEEALEWLANHEAGDRITSDMSLADLYARVKGGVIGMKFERPAIGFSARR